MRNHSTIWFASGFDWLTMICESECQTKRTHVKSWWGQNRERHRIGRLAPRDLGQSLQRRFMNRPSKTPGVCRIDQPSHRTHGFFVRVHHRGKIHPAFFADKKHGGKAAALAAALEFGSRPAARQIRHKWCAARNHHWPKRTKVEKLDCHLESRPRRGAEKTVFHPQTW
jgi:hypothetical protein